MYDYQDGYLIIGELNGGCGYNWSIVAVVYHPDRKAYYVYEDGGCSCNFPYDGWDGDWHPNSAPMSQQEAIRYINQLRNDNVDDDYRLEDYNELTQAIREFDPLTLN